MILSIDLYSGGRCGSIRGCTVGGAGGNLLRSGGTRHTIHAWLMYVDTKASDIDVAVSPDEESAEDRFSEDIKDTVKDSFRVGSDDVTTLRQAPSNWVQEPQADGPDAANSVGPADVGTENTGVAATLKDDCPGDEEEGNAAENEVAPFVGALDQSTD